MFIWCLDKELYGKYDLIGHGFWIIGVVIIIFDPRAIKSDSNKPSIIGALIPLIGAFFGSILTFMSHSKIRVHPIITMTQFYFFSVIYQLVIFPLFTDFRKFYSLDPIHGAFGWLSSVKNIVVVLCIVSPLTGVLEKLCYLTANSYFSLQTISILIVFEPYIGQIFGVALGQDHIPGAMTFIGLVITTVGFWIASYGERLKHNEELRRIIEESLLSSEELDDEDFSLQEMEDQQANK